MKKQLYQITVYTNDFPRREDFTGNFWATHPAEAIKEAREFYAHQNDTTVDQVRVANIKAI